MNAQDSTPRMGPRLSVDLVISRRDFFSKEMNPQHACGAGLMAGYVHGYIHEFKRGLGRRCCR